MKPLSDLLHFIPRGKWDSESADAAIQAGFSAIEAEERKCRAAFRAASLQILSEKMFKRV